MEKQSRRDLLKYFGIGATITPMLHGAPVMEAAATLVAVPEVKPLVVVKDFPAGHSPEHFLERLRWNPYEAIWLRFWQIENNPPSAVNYGVGPLGHCLKREPTDDEKAAVASIIQWFGSNCGRSFVEETLRACGYRVTLDESLRSGAIKKLQHGGIWPTDRVPTEVTIDRRGRRLVLKPGQDPEVF